MLPTTAEDIHRYLAGSGALTPPGIELVLRARAESSPDGAILSAKIIDVDDVIWTCEGEVVGGDIDAFTWTKGEPLS